MTTVPKVEHAASVRHPLSRLTAAEISEVKSILKESGLLPASTRVAYLGLEEPPKAAVLGFRTGADFHRYSRVMLLDQQTGDGRDVVVSLTERAIVRCDDVDAAIGQVPLLDSDFALVEEIMAASPQWQAALARRGLESAKVRTGPLSQGYFGDETEVGRRLVRVVGFAQLDERDLPWAHPVDGLVAVVDLISREIRQLIDDQLKPIPAERAEWDAAPHAAPTRTTLKPINITQPEGPSFSIDDDVIEWENWKVRVGFDAREGLTLHQLNFNDRGRERSVLYRASVAETMVTYADPAPARNFLNYFDGGEYLFCRYTNSLSLGCDCLGEIHYLDATLADEYGDPQTIERAICIHEEDYGILWKHNDLFNGMSEVRRSRRLVISFFTTIGNYDYGFYWYLYLDGTIELEAKATGVVLTSSVESGGSAYATEIAPDLGATYHQHMFCARLDVAIDGTSNFVEEREAVRIPISESNPHGNAFTRSAHRLKSELDGARIGNAATGMVWHIGNPEVTNRLGQPVAYALLSHHVPLLLADESSWTVTRTKFATKHLWVTQYDAAQRYPTGDMVNQSSARESIETYIAADRNIDGEDIVVWHTFGFTHFPRPEDWPVMPVDYTGFQLKPAGFFDRNPTLDLPRSSPENSCHAGGHVN
ncbi:primary-amine oxidase [Mycolicibacterium sp.]|uniref:primary-amine oxidase n=1 Tax=Mycolicibacterium sp. TaxID=2320850 RepID=UPI003D099ABC